MKKAFVLVMVLGLFLGLCSCKKAEPPLPPATAAARAALPHRLR